MAANCVLKYRVYQTYIYINPEWNGENKGWRFSYSDLPLPVVPSSGQTHQLPSMMQLLSQGREAGYLKGFVLESAKVGETYDLIMRGLPTMTFTVFQVDSFTASDTRTSALARIQMANK